MTAYMILEKQNLTILNPAAESGDKAGSIGAWVEVDPNVEASSAKGAIRKYAKGLALEPGGVTLDSRTFVAVPVRSFTPSTVRVEVQQHLTLS